MRDFNNRMRNAKSCVAIREDLIGRVFRHTKDSGFQEEKFEALYVKLLWNESELSDLLDLRIKQVTREKNPNKVQGIKEILPTSISRQNPISYFFDRTMLRPRDAIWFFNHCIKAASGKTQLSSDDIFAAEMQYSESRLSALSFEWQVDFPNLQELIQFLKKYPSSFKEIDQVSQFRDSAYNFVTKSVSQKDEIHNTIVSTLQENDDKKLFRGMMQILYKVGAIGVKNDTYIGVLWSFKEERKVFSDLSDDTVYFVHKSLWKILGIRP